MITLIEIEKGYSTEDVKIKALNTLSIEISTGEFVSFMGPSGCGKSTLLNILGFLDEVDRGRYVFEGRDVTTLHERERASMRMRNIGFLFQNFNLIDELTVYENVELPLLYQGLSAGTRKERTMEILEKMHVGRKAKAFPQDLSGGEQQRVALARALVVGPRILIADEPTANLDTKQGKEVLDILSALHRNGSTILLATHSYRDALCGDRLIQMSAVPFSIEAKLFYK